MKQNCNKNRVDAILTPKVFVLGPTTVVTKATKESQGLKLALWLMWT